MQTAGISKANTKKVTPFTYRLIGNDYLVANDFGDWTFLNSSDFKAYVEGGLKSGTELFDNLRSKNFLIDDLDEAAATKRIEARYKALNYGPHLHILSLNREAVESPDSNEAGIPAKAMDQDLAERAVDLAFMSTSPDLSFAFRGQQPLKDWDLFTYVINYTKNRNKIAFKNIQFSIDLDAQDLDDEKIEWLVSEGFTVRVYVDEKGLKKNSKQAKICAGLSAAFENSSIGEGSLVALFNCTASLAKHALKVVSFCTENGVREIELMTNDVRKIGETENGLSDCSEEEFRSFYGTLLDGLHEAGISEGMTSGYLRSIFGSESPVNFELSSPAIDGGSQFAYDVDGNIYTSDIGRILLEQRDDPIFLIGHVTRTSYQDLILHPTVRALILATTVEAQPGWVNSAYKHYAGKSPNLSYLEHGSIQGRMNESKSTQLQFAILDSIFQRLHGADDAYLNQLKKLAGIE